MKICKYAIRFQGIIILFDSIRRDLIFLQTDRLLKKSLKGKKIILAFFIYLFSSHIKDMFLTNI